MASRVLLALGLLAASLAPAASTAVSTSSWPAIRLGDVPAEFDFCSVNATLAFSAQLIELKEAALGPINDTKTNEMRDYVQSTRGSWDKDMFKKQNPDWVAYARGAVTQPFPIVLFVFAVLSFLAFIPFALGRICRDFSHFTPCCDCDTKTGNCLIMTACGCWCYKMKAWNTYSRFQRMLPVVLYVLFGILALVAAVAALLQIAQFSDGITDIICEADSLRGETSHFVQGITQPMQNIATTAGASIDKVSTVLQGTTAVTLAPVVAQLSAFRATVQGLPPVLVPKVSGSGLSTTITNEPVPEEAQIKAQTVARVQQAETALNGEAGSLSASLSNMRARVETELVSGKRAIEDVAQMATDVEKETTAFLDGSVKDAIVQVKEYMSYPRHQTYVGASFVVALVLVPMAFVLLGYVLILLGTHGCHKCAPKVEVVADEVGEYSIGGGSCCSFLVMIVVFVLAGVCIPAAVVTSDLCVVAETLPNDFQVYMDVAQGIYASGSVGGSGVGGSGAGGSVRRARALALALDALGMEPAGGRGYGRRLREDTGIVPPVALGGGIQPAAIIDACFKNVSLDKALNLTDSFSFASIDFSELDKYEGGAEKFVDLSEFNSIKAEIAALTPETMGYDAAQVAQARAELTGFQTTCVPPVCPPAKKAEATAAIATLDNLRPTIQGQIDQIQAAFAPIEPAIGAFTAQADALLAGLQDARTDAEKLVGDAQYVLDNNLYCGFVGPAYDSIYFSMCGTSLRAVWYLGVAFMCVGLATIPMVVANVFILFRNSHLLAWRHGPNANPEMRKSWADIHGALPETHSFHDGRQWHDGTGGLERTYSSKGDIVEGARLESTRINNPMPAAVEMATAVEVSPRTASRASTTSIDAAAGGGTINM